MLTKLTIDGFKNLVGVDIAFGPFTCIAGANGVGKSNLFDAIRFLGSLAKMPLLEAAASVRGEGGQSSKPEDLFHRLGDTYGPEMNFQAEMIIPSEGVDDLGQEARAAITFLRYDLTLGLSRENLAIRRESLSHINLGDAKSHLHFPHAPVWRKAVVRGRRTSPFISTEELVVKLHQDQGKDYQGGGRPRPHIAERLPRTVLSTVNAAEGSTAVLARREMESWQLIQLEPTALRSPDPYTASTSIAANGAHLPATLARLARRHSPADSWQEKGDPPIDSDAVFARLSNRLAELIEGVSSVRIDADDRRELLTLMLTDNERIEHAARALSDGTLRFLALAILESDPTARGLVCLEEPENGIHPERIPAMLRLLKDLAVDPMSATGEDNPLRQVIVNTHSPAVVAQVEEDDLLVVVAEDLQIGGKRVVRPRFRWLGETWRARAYPDQQALAPGAVISYLNPFEPRAEDDGKPPAHSRRKSTRVMDRPELQRLLPFSDPRNSAWPT